MSYRKSDEHWMSLIQTCRASGLTDRQWCIQNNVSPSTFYYHVRKLREVATSLFPATGATYTPVKQEVVQLEFSDSIDVVEHSPQEANVSSPALSLVINGITMEINNHANPHLITTTVQAIRQLC